MRSVLRAGIDTVLSISGVLIFYVFEYDLDLSISVSVRLLQ